MNKKITRSDIPFARGSYKKAYMTKLVEPSTNDWMFDDVPEKNKIITTSTIGVSGHLNKNTADFKTAMTELVWLAAFNKVDLAPKIYAISLDNYQTYNTYYLYNDVYTVDEVYSEGMTAYDLSQPITIHVLVESCATTKMGELVGPDREIQDEAHLLDLVNTLIEKLLYHETFFMDFKAGNICVKHKNGKPYFSFLDFDPEFIITFDEIGLPHDEIEKACRIYMLVMFVGIFMNSDNYGRTFKNSIQQIMRQRYLAKYDIMYMLNVFIKMETRQGKLCLINKNPLTMLFHYFENSKHSDRNQIRNCDDINKIQYSNGIVPLQSLYNTLVTLICGSDNHDDWLRQLSQPETEIIENYKKMYAKITLPSYKRRLYAQSGAVFSSVDEIRPEFVAPPAPPELDPSILNEPASFSPTFGEKIGEQLLDYYNPKKKSRHGGKRLRLNKRSKRRLRKLSVKHNII